MTGTHETLDRSPVRGLISLVPLAIGLFVFALLLAPMLQRREPLAIWLFAGFLVAHGLIHAMFIPREPPGASSANADYPFGLDRSWLITRAGSSIAVVRPLGLALVALTIGGYLLSAAAAVGLFLAPELTLPLITVASLASAALLMLAFAPTLMLGLVIDAVLLWLSLNAAWLPAGAAI